MDMICVKKLPLWEEILNQGTLVKPTELIQ